MTLQEKMDRTDWTELNWTIVTLASRLEGTGLAWTNHASDNTLTRPQKMTSEK